MNKSSHCDVDTTICYHYSCGTTLKGLGLSLEAVHSLGRLLFDCWDRFHDCFTTRTRDTSALAHVYLKGLLLLPDERNYANIARRIIGPDDDGQSLQQFLSDSPWPYRRVFAQIQREISHEPALRGGILSLDESGDKRSGEFSAGSGRQYLGRLGKVDVGQVGVALSYSVEDFWAMVDAELYLPENWFEAGHAKLRQRLHVPEDLPFATKPPKRDRVGAGSEPGGRGGRLASPATA